MSRMKLVDAIMDYLSIFASKITMSNRNAQYDVNIHAENIMARVLSEIFSCDLKNANHAIKSNCPAIDLCDPHKRIAFQISSDTTHGKVKHTLEQFVNDNDLNTEFNQLYVYFIKEKNKRSAHYKQADYDKILELSPLKFTKKHIIDQWDLYSILNEKNDFELFERVLNILEQEIGRLSYPDPKNDRSVALCFSEDDADIAYPLTLGLIEKGIHVFSNSKILETYINKDFKHQYFWLNEKNEYPKEVTFCVVLVTDSYKIRNNHFSYYKKAKEKNDKVCCIQFSKSIPYSVVSSISPQIHLIINDNYEKAVKYISGKLDKSRSKFSKYKDLKYVLRTHNKQAKYERISIDKDCDSKEKIGYDLYESDYMGITLYWLYLYNGINQGKTYNYIKVRHPLIFEDQSNLNILLPRDEIIDHDLRKKRIKEKFLPKKIYYIDEFISAYWNDYSSDEINVDFLDIDYFVNPFLLDHEKNTFTIDAIKNWLNEEDAPILVLKGSGGIGKTTLAKRISDFYREKNKKSKVIFIESNKVMGDLDKKYESDSLDLYAFYDSFYHSNDHNGDDKFDRIGFKINLDNGNVLIVIDGLDEVITHHPTFDINDFLESITNQDKNIGRAKIILTCRDYFWNEDEIYDYDHFKTFELIPFNKELSRDFFTKFYPNQPKLVDKCLKWANNFCNPDGLSKPEFIPYALDVVTTIIDREEEFIESDTFVSDYLDKRLKNDYIIYSICSRELLKVKHISPDIQIKLFQDFTVMYNCALRANQIDNLFNNNDLNTNIGNIEAFKAHPFLHVTENIIRFKYDFLESFFKGLYLYNFVQIDSSERLNDNIIKILADDCKFNSSLLCEVTSRITNLNEEILTKISDLVEEIDQYYSSMIKLHVKRKAISGLFMLALRVNHDKGKRSRMDNTELLKNIFGGGGKILSLCALIDLNAQSGIYFDFSGFIFKKAYIRNYKLFFDCEFSQDTIFKKSCELYDLNDHKDFSKTTASAENFDNQIKSDESIQKVLERKNKRKIFKENDIQTDLIYFLNIFDTNGRIHPKNTEEVKRKYKRRKHGIVEYRDMFKVLKDLKVIEVSRSSYKNEKINISSDKRRDMRRLVKDNLNTTTSNEIFKKLTKLVK